MKQVIATVLIVGLLIAGYLGYGRYENNQITEAVSVHVKNTTIRLTNAIDTEVNPSDNITIKEYLTRMESDVSEMERRRIEIETIANQRMEYVTAPAITYLKATQEFLRASIHKDRKRVQLSSSKDRAVKVVAIGLARPSLDIKNEARDARQDLENAMKEVDLAVASMISSAERLREARNALGQALPSALLVEPSKIDTVVAAIRKEASPLEKQR